LRLSQVKGNDTIQCCGSGIRCLFDPGIRIDEQPGSYFLELRNPFLGKILKFFDADPGTGMKKIQIRDPGSPTLIPSHRVSQRSFQSKPKKFSA
jgi:hypothetical protein